MHSGPTSFSGSDQEWARQIEERLSRIEKALAKDFMAKSLDQAVSKEPAEEPKKIR